MLWTVLSRRNKRKVDVRLSDIGKLDFCFFSRFGQTLQSLLVFTKIDTFCLSELFGHIVNDLFVEVVAAKVRVARSGHHFKYAITDFKNRNVKRTAA